MPFLSFGVQEPPRTAGFVGRVSGALRMAMAKVERSQRGGEGESRGVVDKEWDPELGQTDSKRRGREGWGRGVAAGAGSRSSGCTERSSSESSSSESSSSSGSDESSDIDSAAHTGDGHTRRRRSGGPSTTRRQSGRSSRGSEAAEPPRSPKGDRITSYRSVVNLRSSSSSRRRLERSRHRRESRRSRNRRSSRRHYSRQRKVDAKRRSEAYSSAEGSRVAQTAAIDGLADLGRQAVASVAKIALRAVLGSWKGVTTAAVKAIRTLQVRADVEQEGG